MQRTLTKSEQDPNRNVEAYMLLAMSHQRLNNRAEMRAAMAKGLEIAGSRLHKLDSDDLGWSWGECIFAHALVAEARTLIGRQSEAVGNQPVEKE